MSVAPLSISADVPEVDEVPLRPAARAAGPHPQADVAGSLPFDDSPEEPFLPLVLPFLSLPLPSFFLSERPLGQSTAQCPRPPQLRHVSSSCERAAFAAFAAFARWLPGRG